MFCQAVSWVLIHHHNWQVWGCRGWAIQVRTSRIKGRGDWIGAWKSQSHASLVWLCRGWLFHSHLDSTQASRLVELLCLVMEACATLRPRQGCKWMATIWMLHLWSRRATFCHWVDTFSDVSTTIPRFLSGLASCRFDSISESCKAFPIRYSKRKAVRHDNDLREKYAVHLYMSVTRQHPNCQSLAGEMHLETGFDRYNFLTFLFCKEKKRELLYQIIRESEELSEHWMHMYRRASDSESRKLYQKKDANPYN